MKEFLIKDAPEEMLFTGIYFKSKSDVSSDYIIVNCGSDFEGQGSLEIYSTDFPSNTHLGTEFLENGCKIQMFKYDCEELVSLSLSGKYFFPTFSEDMQMYYSDKKYYGGKNETDQIKSLFECINYAIDFGLKEFNIKPY